MDQEEDTFEVLKNGKCERCNGRGSDLHTCPFSEELYQDLSECNCCDNCAGQCAMDI